jgi:glyoxylase-like metal-dependent hydrolase (beta-lactamase superfamily II)
MSDPTPAGRPRLSAEVFTSPFHRLNERGDTFSPTTSTLVAGSSEAVLIDAQYIRADVIALGDLIERSGKRLTTIYVTHSHADHWFGIGELLRRFPSAVPVAVPSVLESIKESVERETGQWATMFGDAVVEPSVLPDVLDGDTIELEGAALHVIEVAQGDIHPNTVVHVPEIGTVVAGDVVYNQIHAMLGFCGPEECVRWIETLDAIERLAPATIVAGHKKPGADDSPAAVLLDQTRAYVNDFADAARTAETARELVAIMTAQYPDFGNPWTLSFSAKAWCVPGRTSG